MPRTGASPTRGARPQWPWWWAPSAPPRARSARGSWSRIPARWWGRSRAGASSPTSTCAPRRCSRAGLPQLLQYGISDDDAFDVGLPCGGEIEVFVQMLDPEELDRIDSAVQAGERLSVTTTLNGDSAGAKAYGEGEGHSSAVRTDETTFVEHFAPPPVVDDLRRGRHRPGAVPDGKAGRASRRSSRTPARSSRRRSGCRTPTRSIVGWPAMAYDAAPARRRHLRRRPDARPALRRARAGPGAALRRAVHRRAGQPAGAGDAARAPAERRLHRRRDRADPRAARPRHRRA